MWLDESLTDEILFWLRLIAWMCVEKMAALRAMKHFPISSATASRYSNHKRIKEKGYVELNTDMNTNKILKNDL